MKLRKNSRTLQQAFEQAIDKTRSLKQDTYIMLTPDRWILYGSTPNLGDTILAKIQIDVSYDPDTYCRIERVVARLWRPAFGEEWLTKVASMVDEVY
jgi:cystathionine beta-lyase/cystathionine gamma-synthase